MTGLASASASASFSCCFRFFLARWDPGLYRYERVDPSGASYCLSPAESRVAEKEEDEKEDEKEDEGWGWG